MQIGSNQSGSDAIGHIYRVRARVLTAFGAAIAFVSDLGPERWLVVIAIVAVVLPYNMVLEELTHRRGEVPAFSPMADQVLGIASVVVVPDLWMPVLMVNVATLATAATVFPARKVAAPAVVSVVLATAVGFATHDGIVSLAGSVGFAGAAAIAVLSIRRVTLHRMQLESENQELVQNIDAIVWELTEGDDGYRTLSEGANRILDYPTVNLRDLDFWMEHVHRDDRNAVGEARRRSLTSGARQVVDYRMHDGAGRVRWFHEVISCERPAPAAPATLRGVVVDVTTARAAEEERALFAEVFEHLDSALIVAQLDRLGHDDLTIRAANPSTARLFGVSGDRLVGTPLPDLVDDADGEILQHSAEIAARGGAVDVEHVHGLGIDRQRTHTVHVFGLPDRAVGLVIEDVTEASMVATALRRQALHDGLTGLPNRTLLRDRLQYALADARRRDERVALILLDLNHFKEVNDALGHQYGDRLLVAFSRRLQGLLRECDTIARLGGDEFALLLTAASPDGAARVVGKVTESMQDPFDIDGVTVQSTASVGVALYPDHADDADLLTQRADVAMYNAKRNGGGWSVYSPQQDQSSVERLRLLSELHGELDGQDPPGLRVRYQPIMDLADDRVTGAEALLRWPHPELGDLNPELVVELAELSGLIQPLARFVTSEAVREAAGWRRRGVAARVAVNLSARNLYDRHLVSWLAATLDDHGVEPELLKCELTESQVMDDPVLAMAVLGQLRDIGVTTSIDDFGTGYSSLAYLRRLPVDEIKIDKSFVTSMLADTTELTIVRTIIELSHNLGMSVLAEGVEDQRTMEALRELGCDRVQGYHIGRPTTAEALGELLVAPHPTASGL